MKIRKVGDYHAMNAAETYGELPTRVPPLTRETIDRDTRLARMAALSAGRTALKTATAGENFYRFLPPILWGHCEK